MTELAPNMFANVSIEGISFQAGSEYLPIEHLVDTGFLSTSVSRKIRENGTTGYHRNSSSTPADLAAACVANALETSRIAPSQVDLLVFTSTIFETTSLYPDLVARQIAQSCGCYNAKTFALQHLYCVSPLAALRVVAGYLKLDPGIRNAIIVCSDCLGSITEHLRAIDTSGLHSDGAAALLLRNGGKGYRLLDIELFTDVAKYQGHNPDGTIVNSALNFAITAKLLKKVMTRNKLDRGHHVNLCVNNLDLHAWLAIASVLGIEGQHVHFNRHTGHVFGADPFLNLLHGCSDDTDFCLLVATGVAGSFGVALLEVPRRD